MNPLVSIVMPVWNGEKYLPAAMDSILAQTFGDFEFIIVDDGSTDRTPAILESYSDPRLRIHRLNHAGIVMALNHGLAQARAAWIARQDADDISLPHRLEKQWKAISSRPGAVLSYSDVEFIGEGSASAGSARFPRTRSFLALRLCYQNPIVHSTVLFNKQAALAAGGYRPEERHAEDFALWGRMLLRGEFVGLPEKLVRLRLHGNSVSQQNLTAQLALTQKIATRHSQSFLQIPEDAARRAHFILNTAPGKRSWWDWGWFLIRCAPRLKWKSAETLGWLILQSASLLKRD